MPDKLPLHSMPRHNLFGLENQEYEKSRVIVLPIPYDSTVTYKTGTREGPNAIIDASRNVELYSKEIGKDISKIGIYTLAPLEPDVSSPENMIARIKKEVGIILDDGKIPLLLGGEHTITLGAIQAFKERNREISVIQFDAHTDSRDEMYGSKYMHATVMARVKEVYPSIFQIGIRSMDEEFVQKVNASRVIFSEDIRKDEIAGLIYKIADFTSGSVYITVDVDVLDPSEMPSVGTPEPGGLRYSELMSLIEGLASNKKLAGLDFVELCPIPYMHAPDFLVAKMAYMTLGYFLSKPEG